MARLLSSSSNRPDLGALVRDPLERLGSYVSVLRTSGDPLARSIGEPASTMSGRGRGDCGRAVGAGARGDSRGPPEGGPRRLCRNVRQRLLKRRCRVRLLDVRVARNDQARAGHLRETLLLPWMDGRLGVDLPVPRRLVEPSLALPFGAIVQPSLQGRVMTAEDGSSESLASEFGRALAAFAWTGLVGCTRGEPSAVGPS